MSQQLQPVKLSEIVMNAGTQMRAWMNTEKIAEYAALMKEGIIFDPIEVYLVGEQIVLVDGFHRVNGAMKAGREALDAHITVGTLEEAIWAAIAANKKNALQRNSSDVAKAIEAALLHPNGAGLSDRAIALHVGCTHPTVGSVRAKLVATGKLTSQDERTGKDGRTINTAKIGVKHQMEHWHELVYKPWLKTIQDKADLILIHKDAEYLHILLEASRSGKDQPAVQQRYHLGYTYFSPRGSHTSGYGARFDMGYVELFEEDGLKVYIEEFKDLSEGMQRVVKAAMDSRGYGPKLYTLKRVDPQLQPGDKAARLITDYSGTSYPVVASVIGVSKSFIHVRKLGSDQDEVWFGSQIVPLDSYTIGQSPVKLNIYHQWSDANKMNWQKEYAGLKKFYAQQAILFVKSNDAYIALQDDALQAAAQIPGISAHDEHLGAVFITFDANALKNYGTRFPVMIYQTNRETARNFWQQIVAAQAQPSPPAQEPPPAPAPAQIEAPPEALNGNQQYKRLWDIWNALEQIGDALNELDPGDDDPISELVLPYITLKHLAGKQIGVEVEAVE